MSKKHPGFDQFDFKFKGATTESVENNGWPGVLNIDWEVLAEWGLNTADTQVLAVMAVVVCVDKRHWFCQTREIFQALGVFEGESKTLATNIGALRSLLDGGWITCYDSDLIDITPELANLVLSVIVEEVEE